jgi:hypothetical protein
MSQENVEIVRGVRIALSLPSEKAGRRRSLDERLYLRFPALYRLLADRVARLPPRSRLRRLMLTRSAARGLAAVNRRDFEVFFLAFDSGIEYHPAGDQLPPGMDEVTHGHDGYEKLWRQMIDSFENFHAEPEELLDLGERLLVTIRYEGHGSGSGVPIKLPLFQLFKVERGVIVWQKDFNDRSEALEAAGLSE